MKNGTSQMEIVLHGDLTHYQPGDLISGALRFPPEAEVNVKSVEISLNGLIQGKWLEVSPHLSLKSLGFEKNKKCLEMVHVAFKEDIENLNKQTDGVREVAFQFKLPDCGIPSSFIGLNGTISYNLVATVKGADDEVQRVEREIKVLAPLEQDLTVSVGGSVEKDFGLLSLATGRIILYASLPKKGYHPGETMEVHCDIYNQSSVECTPRATIYQTQIYMCDERHKATQVPLIEPVVGQKLDKESNGTQVLNVELPVDMPLSIKSDIIAIKYVIHVTLDIPHAIDVHMNLPFVVVVDSKINVQK